VLNKTVGAEFNIGGNWDSYYGRFIPNSRVVTLFVQRTWNIQEATPSDNHAALTLALAFARKPESHHENDL